MHFSWMSARPNAGLARQARPYRLSIIKQRMADDGILEKAYAENWILRRRIRISEQ